MPSSSTRTRRWPWIGAGVVAAVLVFAWVFQKPLQRRLVILFTPDYQKVAARYHQESVAAPRGPIRWIQVAGGLTKPTGLEFVPGGRGLAIALEQGGKARLVDLSHAGDTSPIVASPGPLVLDLATNTDAEMGLIGFAFHPRWRENGRIFVHFNPSGGALRTHIAEYALSSSDIGHVGAHDERLFLVVPQPYGNHKGGQLVFGPDGFLYIGLGDGGWRGDPEGNGQSLATLLGKILRIDVDHRGRAPYAVPPDNPFLGRQGARPEIWAYGLRNPWRFSFDPHGRIVVGDVGQDRFEEIDVVRRGDNLGWNFREGAHCFQPHEGCRTEGLVEPVFEYGREGGSCVVGGFVYEGSAIPELAGQYVFGDFVTGALWAIRLPSPFLPPRGPVEARDLGKSPLLISSFAHDESGEIYAVDYGGGGVYRLAAGMDGSRP